MRSNAKFKHTNFLKRDRYQAKLNAGKTVRVKLKKKGVKTWAIIKISCVSIGNFIYAQSEV